MLRDSDGDIGGGKFNRSGFCALSSYILPYRACFCLNESLFSLVAWSDVRLGEVPMKEPQNGTFGQPSEILFGSLLAITILSELSVLELHMAGVCRFRRDDRPKTEERSQSHRLRADDLEAQGTYSSPDSSELP